MALADLGGGPAVDFFAVTTSDVVGGNFAKPARALHIGVAGNVAAVSADGSVVTFKGLAAGQLLPVRCVRVNSTNTTATDIVGLV